MALTLNVAGAGAVTVCAAGCEVRVGASSTVMVATLLVTGLPMPLLTTTL